MVLCTCCQSEVNSPVFVNNLPYGYTCAKKVGYTGKRESKNVKTVGIEKIFFPTNSSRGVVVINNEGDILKLTAYLDIETGRVKAYQLIGCINLENFIGYMYN